MVWCQFGRCIRGGLGVKDVVNDNVGKDCCVKLEFNNGYAITRYRKHKVQGNRVVISSHGNPLPQFEHPDMRTTQSAINELLGTNYETYIRTVVLSEESAASFLSSTPTQRWNVIETALGLFTLDQCEEVLKLLLRDIGTDIKEAEKGLEGVTRTVEYTERRLQDLTRTHTRLEAEARKEASALERAVQDHAAKERLLKEHQTRFRYETSQSIADSSRQILGLEKKDLALELNVGFHAHMSGLQTQIRMEEEALQQLNESYARMKDEVQVQHERVLKYKQSQEAKDAQECVYSRRMEWLALWLEMLDEKLKALAAGQPSGLPNSFHGMRTSVVSWLSTAIVTVMSLLRRPTNHNIAPRGSLNQDAQSAPIHDAEKTTTQNHDQEAALKSLLQAINEKRLRLRSLKHEKNIAANHARNMGELLTGVVQAQEACDALRQQLTIHHRNASTYKRLAEAEASSLDSLRSEHEALTNKLQELATKRELFAFWSAALTKRTARLSSSPSSSKPTAKIRANFREHILIALLSELNTLLAQVLTVLYDDTRHAHLATGMLGSLFDSAESGDSASSPGSILDQKLALPSSLAYAKRSSGERKRVDLALFFALLQLTRARSAHRAHYLLVDEVFDNLDKAGQAAVVRWCGVMSQTRMVGWIIVITHSQFLIELDPGEDTAKVLVVTAKMGRGGGTELSINNGRSIGGGSSVTG